jgi:hypothetical protein
MTQKTGTAEMLCLFLYIPVRTFLASNIETALFLIGKKRAKRSRFKRGLFTKPPPLEKLPPIPEEVFF